MSIQLQSITSGGKRGRRRAYAGLAAIMSCTLAFIVAADAASAQSATATGRSVQPNTAAAARHRAPVTSNEAAIDATVTHATALQTRPATVQDSSQQKPLNRTARAHLGTSRPAGALPSVAMICENCDPAPPCRVSPALCQNSPIVDGAVIAAKR
jgi:hypothetical protein